MVEHRGHQLQRDNILYTQGTRTGPGGRDQTLDRAKICIKDGQLHLQTPQLLANANNLDQFLLCFTDTIKFTSMLLHVTLPFSLLCLSYRIAIIIQSFPTLFFLNLTFLLSTRMLRLFPITPTKAVRTVATPDHQNRKF